MWYDENIYTDEDRTYYYKGNNTMVTIEQIERILLKYYDEAELNDSGCYYNGRRLSLEKIVGVIAKNA